ncbi:hypothetical protein KXV50_008637 [Aspergillus fumigatus]|nr:hypothetical protein KXW47_000186 [Aspergillus fumigatus]KAH2203054.1 hypothetical protein KXW61_004490 [Aspergillus fumigatus]KAH2297087.1 hypothetical protein KXV50_008637 [Aspergillus fumigatus]KAJ8153762.1 hypothetical protein LV165_006413 [Aspergillus fumigatus]KAJ8166331.1 hypothetical protein LV162_002669 [Aspergillus fumigatus]
MNDIPNPHGTGLVVLIWILTGISVVVVSLRVLAKTKIRQFRIDDVVMIVVLILGIISGSLHTTAVKYGYGLPDATVPEPVATTGRKFYIIGLASLILCSAVGRAAFVLYLLAILGGQKGRRIILTALAILEMVFNSVSVILIFATCTPVSMVWDYAAEGTCTATSIQPSELTMRCDASAFNVFFGGPHEQWPCRDGRRYRQNRPTPEIYNDALGGTVNLLRWGYIEADLVIITASLPCLRSVILSGFHYMTSSGHRSRSYELGAAYTGTHAGTASVTAQATSHRKTDSRLRGMLSTRNRADDGASVDRILGSRNSLDGVETGGSSQEGSAGIRKQVEVTVVADDRRKSV